MIKHTENGARAPADDAIRLLDYAAVLLHRWRTVAVCTALALVAGVAIVKLSPATYRANTVLVPSPEQNGGSGLMSELPAFMVARMGGGSPDRKLVAGILHSRSLRDSVIETVARSRPQVPRSVVEQVVSVDTRRKVSATDASITIEVDAPDPRLARDVANAYPALINRMATRLTVETAAGKREVVERQLAQAGERLARSEERLLAFQRSSGTADVQEQARQGMQTAAAVQGQILQKEVQVAELRRSLAPGHPRLRSAESELATMRGQLERLTTGGGASGLFPGARQVPELAAQAADVLREYKTNEQVYIALGAELANAQVNVSQDVAVVTVLDAAVLPKVPQQSLLRVLVAALLLGLTLGTVLAFVREYMARVRRDPENEPFRMALDQFKTDVTGVFRRGGRTPAGRA